MFNQDMPYDNNIDINITNENINSNTNMNMNTNENYGGNFGGTACNPIIEAGRERCVYRNIYHEVPQE